MSNHRVVEKRGRFYPQYYVPYQKTVFLLIFKFVRKASWKPFLFAYEERPVEERSFSTKEQAILWIKTGSPYHPDKVVWEE
jgi:hypothetical protein